MRIALLAAACLVLSGCAAPQKLEEPSDPEPFSFDYTKVTWPDALGARGFLDSYVMTHPYRIWGLPTSKMVEARDSLVGLLEGFGLDRVERQSYNGQQGVNILGFINGTTNPHEWVVLSAHYDTWEGTVYGAWDDGSGVAVLLELARVLKDWEFPFTVVFAFFDEEEQGLVGSEKFVQIIQKRTDFNLVANLNTDPPGLNWPCEDAQGPLPVVVWPDAELDSKGMEVLAAAVEQGLDRAQVPKDVRSYPGGIPIVTVAGEGITGGSDHQSFGEQDIPNLFLGSAPVAKAGPVEALSYALHTPADTAQQMEARCGNGMLAEGMGVIATALAGALVDLAKHPTLELD